MHRAENLQRLATEEFDLCIIGGGASGAGCALDAVLRGLKVALIEKSDFAAETSGKSTKLIHGGVRYLEQAFKNLDFAQLRQVRHGLEERHVLLQNAPNLAKPLGLITPVFSWWEGLYFWIGLKLYDWIAGKKRNLPPSRWLSKKETLHRMPGMNPRIHSAVLYFDGQLDDARYCLALVQSASERNVAVANHLELVELEKHPDGKIKSAVVIDLIDKGRKKFEIKARRFLNCTGAHADTIRQLANFDLQERIRPSKGVHLVLSLQLLQSEHAMLIPKTRDGRMVFAVPFEGCLLLGTTDEPYTALDKEPVLERKEMDFLIDTLQPYITQPIDKNQVQAGFGGIRPLITPSHQPNKQNSPKQTKSLLRDHEVEHDPVSGLFSLLGGKWTTYRIMARDAVDQIYWSLPLPFQHSSTADCVLFGSANYIPDLWIKIFKTYGLDSDICQHLALKYGDRAIILAELAHDTLELSERLLPNWPYLKAEVVYAAQFEMALTVRDFLARRIRLEILDWEAAISAAPVVAKYLGQTLNWTAAEIENNAAEYIELVLRFAQKLKQTATFTL